MEEDKRVAQAEKKDSLTSARLTWLKLQETKDKSQRLRIVQTLFRMDAPWALDVLLDCLADRSIEIRTAIARHLVAREKIDLALLYKRLSSPPWNVKIEILKILGLRKDEGSAQHIAAVVKDSNVDVRKTAAEVLGLVGGKEAAALLVQLAKDKNPFVRRSAEKSLRETSELKFM